MRGWTTWNSSKRPPRPRRRRPLAPAPAAPAAVSIPDQLNQLAALHDQGALSDDEFTAAKSRLLAG